MKLRKGDRFRHRRVMDAERAPQLCVVTAVRQGVVYYRPDYGRHDDGTPWLGSPSYFLVDDAARWADPC